MFEHKRKPLIPRAAFMARLSLSIGIAFGIVCGSLAIGVIGYRPLYALYSGIVFLVTAGFVIAPLLHRFLHRFHLESGK
jgi:hypothetical protein